MTIVSKSNDGSEPPEAITESTPPAGRRRRKLRKEEIVSAATRLFAERGYEGASMGDLAERVGLRKASLFHHFPSKDVLYATVLGHLLDNVKSAVNVAAASEGNFEARLDALSDALTVTLGSDPHAARLLVREAMDWGPVMRDRLAGTIREVLDAAVTFMRHGQSEGLVDPEIEPRQLVVSLTGVYFMPFAIGEIVEGFAGSSPFEEAFVGDRVKAIRHQLRRLILVRR